MIWTVVVAVCLVVAFAGGWIALKRRSRFGQLPVRVRPLERHSLGTVRGVRFPAIDGTMLDGWLFLPKADKPPIVVVAPGLGGTKDGFLEPFAWSFAERGVATLLFDYRCFGGSEGEPRHWVDPERHRQDYEAAVAFVRGVLSVDGEVDATRLGLWGSSFSGGTVIMLAAGRADVRAVVAQCPFLETPPALHPRGLDLWRFVFWAMLDSLRVLPPIYVPLFGRSGEWVFARSKDNPSVKDFDGPMGSAFWKLLPKPGLGGWDNRMLARMLTSIGRFVPMAHVDEVKCPMLLVAAREDDMVPLPYVERAFHRARSPGKELAVFEGGHYDLYVGAPHPENAKRQAEFLARHLAVTTA